MVVKMMKWRAWPPWPTIVKKYEVKIIIRRLEGLSLVLDKENIEGFPKLMVEIRWKGQKLGLSSLRRSVKINTTKEESMGDDGVVEWNEEFHSVCNLSAHKENSFHPWEIGFAVFQSQNRRPRQKMLETALLNLADFTSVAEAKGLENEINIPLTFPGHSVECCPSLWVSLSLLELRTSQALSESVQQSLMPVSQTPEKGDVSPIKAGLKMVKIFSGYVSVRRAKKTCHEDGSDGKNSVRSEDVEYNYPFDTDSLDDSDEGDLEESKEEPNVRKSFSYGSLAHANWAGGSLISNSGAGGQDEDWIYHKNCKYEVESSPTDNSTLGASEQSSHQSSKRGILSWRKRKLNFRSPKARGEPLLRKDYGEEGGDDIDFDRRQLSSSDESTFWYKSPEDLMANRSSVSEFGDDNFAVGSWESKEITSRDGHLKLQTQVFFASIDQRSERAAGESACTALVAVIANWLESNRDQMPIKSQLDSLIGDGSLEWRNLCENDAYKERFPDKHFDLETVLQAKVRPLCVLPEKSFIGFFHPEGLEDGGFDFLHGAMSFDSIWDEISQTGSNIHDGDSLIYIVSWNDHFFILKVERDAYYIIDTLGERLFEGCNQAYILKFDKDTMIHCLPNDTQSSDEKPAGDTVQQNNAKDAASSNSKDAEATMVVKSDHSGNNEQKEIVLCSGKESCREYIKSFLAAIPIRELQVDLKKGLMASTPIHHRLQIEFHHTQLIPAAIISDIDIIPSAMPVVPVEAVVEQTE
ncbi:NT-type C2 domain [Dillenia turbinata]|uniref:NT-type C2 domain n=1 Tax=Dillenia turbinata TaxID=194707 RepID=A0AAN8VKY7_9MAGN